MGNFFDNLAGNFHFFNYVVDSIAGWGNGTADNFMSCR